jgi:hypothetical protein
MQLNTVDQIRPLLSFSGSVSRLDYVGDVLMLPS